MDFSLRMYEGICHALKSYQVVTVEQYLSQTIDQPFVVLRHDVDRELDNALAMARLEHEYGITSTYYFRYPKTFDIKTIAQIGALGHEIGYHYEVLDKAKGDYEGAMELFREELAVFRKFFPVHTVCMHGNPLTKWDGRDIWQLADYHEFDLLGEAYLSCTELPVYLTDTGRNWMGKHNAKDNFSGKSGHKGLQNTSDVISYLERHSDNQIYLNCHPERWSPSSWGWAKVFMRDNLFNLGKRLLRLRVPT